MEINLVGENLIFMLLGMAIVLIFQFIMKRQAKIINKFPPEKAPKIVPAPSNDTNNNSTNDNAIQEAHHVAAIVAAVAEFRKQS